MGGAENNHILLRKFIMFIFLPTLLYEIQLINLGEALSLNVIGND